MTRLTLKIFVFILLLVTATSFAHAQVLNAKVGINGLTCSQCSRSVEIQLRKLSFVTNVNMNLEHTEGTLQFKEGSKIDFQEVAKAVKDAGFSVRFLTAKIDMDRVEASDNGFKIGNDFYFIQKTKMMPSGTAEYRFLGKMYSAQKNDAKVKTASVSNIKGHIYNVSLAADL